MGSAKRRAREKATGAALTRTIRPSRVLLLLGDSEPEPPKKTELFSGQTGDERAPLGPPRPKLASPRKVAS